MAKKILPKNLIIWLSVVVAVAILNFITQIIVSTIKLPVFLDTWATSLGVLFGGLWAGIIGGVLYNIVMAGTRWGWDAWIWSFANIWIALVTYLFYKLGWLDMKKIGKVIIAGLILGFTNALLTFQITVLYFKGLPTYAPTAWLNAIILGWSSSPEVAAFFEHLAVEFVDKTIMLVIAVWVFSKLPFRFGKQEKTTGVKKANPTA